MSYSDKTIAEFTADLAAKLPVPGGGGAAALCGALAAALGSMVANYTIGKKKYAEFEQEIVAAMTRAEEIRARLVALIDEDAEAFEPLSRAYSIPKDDPKREETLEACLKEAAKAPMEMTELCGELIDLARVFAEKGSTLMASDAGCMAILAKSAMLAAALNVKVNTKLLRDKAEAQRMNDRVTNTIEQNQKAAETIYEQIYKKL